MLDHQSRDFAPGSTYVVEVASASNPSIYRRFGLTLYRRRAGACLLRQCLRDRRPIHDGRRQRFEQRPVRGRHRWRRSARCWPNTRSVAGDIVYVDAGIYNLTNNIVFGAADSGTGTLPSQTITIQGPTQPGLSAIFNRQGTTSGFYDFEFKGASYVTQYLTIGQ